MTSVPGLACEPVKRSSTPGAPSTARGEAPQAPARGEPPALHRALRDAHWALKKVAGCRPCGGDMGCTPGASGSGRRHSQTRFLPAVPFAGELLPSRSLGVRPPHVSLLRGPAYVNMAFC